MTAHDTILRCALSCVSSGGDAVEAFNKYRRCHVNFRWTQLGRGGQSSGRGRDGFPLRQSVTRCRQMAQAERCEWDGTNRLRTAEKIGTKRSRPAHDRKPCIIRSRLRIGTWEFSARLFNPLWERCSTSGKTVRLAAP